MAERRMFAKTIIDSDLFLDMPMSTQCLYFHLNMRADDDGFINNPKKIQRMIGCGDDDLKLLIAKQFIVPFESGIVVIKHWKIHNYIQKDRYKETFYKKEKSLLQTDKNKEYFIGMDTNCIQSVSNPDTQVRLGKDRLEIEKEIYIEQPSPSASNSTKTSKEQKHKYGEFKHVLLTDKEKDKLLSELGEHKFNLVIKRLDEYIEETGKKYKNHNLTIRRWVIDAVTKENPQVQSNRTDKDDGSSVIFDPRRDLPGYWSEDDDDDPSLVIFDPTRDL